MFDYTSHARSRQTVVCTPELLRDVMRMTTVRAICADIRDALEQVKRGEMSRADFETYKRQQKQRLPAFCFQAHFTDHLRHNQTAVPSGLSLFDIDHLPAPEVFYEQSVKARTGSLGIALAHVTPSTEGLRLVFALHEGETPKDGQRRMARALGLNEYDESCKDLARCSFAVPEDYVLHIDEELLFREPASPTALPEGEEELQKDSPLQTETPAPVLAGVGAAPAPSPAELRIFDDALTAAGLTPASLVSVGHRHNSLTAILSTGICRLIPQERLWAVIGERMPRYAAEPDCRQLVADFYSKYTDPNRPMSSRLRRIYAASLHAGAGADPDTPAAAPQADLDTAAELRRTALDTALQEQQRILHTLPPALRATLDGLPPAMRMPVLCAVLPLAAAYADGVTVRYCDGMPQRLGLMSIIVGPQASGKSACKAKIDLWIRQMADDDARAREIEDKWKQARKSRRANEKAPDDPCVLIRSVPVTISCSTLLRRFKNSRAHTLYSFGEELDTLRKTNGAGSWSSKYDIYRLAFDHGQWGQDYNSDQAESGMVEVAYNFSILGTYGALRKCFKADNVENGLSSRIIIAEMPDAAFAPMPTYGQARSQSAALIDEAVTRLRAAQGFVDTPRLRRRIARWVEEKRQEAMADGDLVKDTYRKRAAVIGFRCGVIALLLEGRESNHVLDFACMMAQYVLEGQCRTFGPSLLGEYRQADDEMAYHTHNGSVFDSLSPVFSLDQLRQIKGPSVSRNTLYTVIFRWKKAGWIEKTGINQWKKTRREEAGKW